MTWIKQAAGILGGTAVMAGAFGAHLLKDHITPDRLATWETAARYQLVHAVALLVLALLPNPPFRTALLFVVGSCIFSGSLYTLVLSDIGLFGAITPIGGLCLIGGWLMLLLPSR
jgi:uncharacterized membrane protein YgdD (TMEM256/DUF423 family)